MTACRISLYPRTGTLVAPSILSADFGHLADEVSAVEQASADWIHVDVMDGRFVPNITIGPPVVAALRKVTALPLDVHLMIAEPEKWIDAFADAGADVITVHAEACAHLHRTLQAIRARGCLAGVSLNPATHENAIEYVLPICDLVLVMSVNPGFGGQSFLSEVVPKIASISKMLSHAAPGALLEVDGGITGETATIVAANGAQVLVAGNAVFGRGADAYADAISEIRTRANDALGVIS
jgi:ribulose-phosphate 3-epimerase